MKSSLHDTLYPWLEPREELLWAGRPEPLRMAKARIGLALAGLAAIGLLFLTPLWHHFAPVSTVAASSYNQGDINFMDSLPFSIFLAGLILIAQPFAAYHYAGRTTYAVTERRLFMVRKDMLGILVKTARYETIETPVLNVRSDGTGDIFFFRRASMIGNDRGPSPLTRFLGIRDAGTVHQMICRLTAAASGQGQADPVHDYLEFLIQGKKGPGNSEDR